MATLNGMNLIIVEDDPDSGELLKMLLEGHGAGVRLAENAADARVAIRERHPDVVLTDVSMAGEDGFTFVASLRAEASTRGIPVIAITGYSDARSRRRALDAGFQKYITKPFDVFTLPAAIASVVAEAARGTTAALAMAASAASATPRSLEVRNAKGKILSLPIRLPWQKRAL